jgi:hypothetical protein
MKGEQPIHGCPIAGVGPAEQFGLVRRRGDHVAPTFPSALGYHSSTALGSIFRIFRAMKSRTELASRVTFALPWRAERDAIIGVRRNRPLEGRAMISDGSYLSWEEVQRLMLPPNATMLVPPPLDPPADVPALTGPPPKPDWLEDGYVGVQPPHSNLTITPEEAHSAAEKAKHGDAVVRILANAITVNAVLEFANSPRKAETEDEDDEAKRRRKELS